MEPRTPPQEWMLLSEYVDGQLDAHARAQLEQQLAERSDLREALDELRLLKSKLHAAPRLRAPRNFTLKAEMAPQRRKSFGERFFRLTSAFAAAGAVLTLLLVQFLPRLMPSGAPLTASAPMAMMESAPAEEPMIIEWGYANGMGGGVGGGGGDGTTYGMGGGDGIAPAPAEGMTVEKSAEPTPTPEIAEAAPVEPTVESGAMLAPQPTNEPEAPAAPAEQQPDRSVEDTSGSPLILGIAPEEQQGQALPDQPSSAPASEIDTPTKPDINWILVEIILAAIAIGSGLTAWLLHRRAAV